MTAPVNPVFDGAHMRDMRKDLGWSQHDLARVSGMTVSVICDLEKGRRKNPTLKTFIRLANLLGVSDVRDLVAWKSARRERR